MSELKAYQVWDAESRWFHWINVLCVVGLAGVGTTILFANSFDASNAGKINLKKVHAFIGYVFALNLFFRFVWAFTGNRYARWRSFLPGGRGYLHSLRSYVTAFVSGPPENYLGHNPIGRIGVTLLLILISIQAVTGLVLAGTDLFFPPFGFWIAQWVAAPGVDPATLVPYAPEMYDTAAWDAMRSFRKPFITLHETSFYILMCGIVIHVAGVIITEKKEGGSLISAMFTGTKIIKGEPVDKEDNQDVDD
ncbi:MAG: cytochrome b/b6 domain-containing protein [Gammaproteobacteria bacterium]|nr:cytochrome b/b6 domain-containing protein [Gammaproteobacteria bacterium]